MSDPADPYLLREDGMRAPPATWAARLRHLGPSVVISGSIVGSGELILTPSLGAIAGFALLWWMLVCCWSKSIVQAELARYVVVSGDTYLRALNRIPGKVPGPRGPVSWTLWFTLLSFIPGVIGMGGIVGGTGQAVSLFMPDCDYRVLSVLVALAASAILYSGSYRRLERSMLLLVAGFTAATLIAAIALQHTGFRVSADELASGFRLEFPSQALVLGLAVYGATGVNAAEISTYTYWCIEKGYAQAIGARRSDPDWPDRARGWLRLLQLDVSLTLVILTCATLPFYLLGAAVLHATGQNPQGLETVSLLSAMFTETLGSWSLWLFGGAAFCILFSSVVAGFGGISRFAADYLVEFGYLDRAQLAPRLRWTRAVGTLLPLISVIFYLAIPNPVALLSIGALAATLLLPMQSGATLWLQQRRMDPRVRPSTAARAFLWLTFVFQLALAAIVVRFVFV
ncbi:MAG TPA: Nramp family divalent metal transporter [Steroidobacteraceae bacterium]|nr:Nramp family divalent metal transporter [Steroidobacteraceae bacterium]